uniref:Methyltransferase FkbM domain-containing protein n=1 Tax=Helicotheca tamesis TaxID=374047 RepID=A0A7S2E2E6_9STRA
MAQRQFNLSARNKHGASRSGLRKAVITLAAAVAFLFIPFHAILYHSVFGDIEEEKQLRATISTVKVDPVDYHVDVECRNLPKIRPSGVFFVDPAIESHESPKEIEPSFHVGSKMKGVSFHMGGDVPHFKLIKELMEEQQRGQDEIAFDIGANQGFFTYFLATLGMQVNSFEIDGDMFRSLQHGTIFNPKDVADRTNLYSMGLSSKVSRFGQSGGTYEGFLRGNDKGPILAVTFDCLAHHLDQDLSKGIAFVKIDVEGFEIAVLQGSHNSLLQHKIGGLIMEVGPKRWDRAQVDHVTGVEEMKRLASRFATSHLIVRGEGAGFAETCPQSLAETKLSDNNPRKLDHVFIHKVLPNEWEPLLEEMRKNDYDCNFWYTNN